MTTTSFTERRFYYFAIAFACLTSAVAAISGSPWYSLAGVLCLSLSALLFIKPQWGIYFLILASASTVVSFEITRFTIRPEQIVTLILAAILLIFLLSGKRPAYTTILDLLIFAYLLINVISSLVHSPDVRTSLQKCVLLSVTFTAYFVSTQLITNQRILSRVIIFLLVLGFLEAIYGIISVALFTKGIDIGGAHAPYGDIYARGTFIEGNIFGSFEMMISLILMSFLLSRHFQRNKGIILLALVITLVASIMSFTRSAWLGFIAGALAYVCFLRRELIARTVKYIPIILVALFLLGGTAYSLSVSIKKGSVSLMDIYIQRFQKILDYRTTHSSSSRVEVWQQSIRFWKRNPILGNGTDSTMPMFGTEYWIPNSMILALHDTGLIGLALFCAIQIAFLAKLWISLQRTNDPYYEAVLEGFFAAFIGAQVAYFFSNAFWLVFIWVFMAIGISCARIAINDSRRAA
jgi:O-antigen ligase